MLKLWWLYKDRDYWAKRAADLEDKLEKERVGNRRYEREITSRMLTWAGQMGIANDIPAQPRKPQVLPPIPPQPTETILNSFTPAQIEDWELYEADAKANGVSVGQAWNDFYQNEILPQMTIEESGDAEN